MIFIAQLCFTQCIYFVREVERQCFLLISGVKNIFKKSSTSIMLTYIIAESHFLTPVFSDDSTTIFSIDDIG